jgi:hypothetical protein
VARRPVVDPPHRRPGAGPPATDPEGRDLRRAALHHLRVALNAAGLEARVHRLPDPAHPAHLAAVETSARTPTPTPDDLALAGAIEHRRSDRRVFSTWPVPPEFLTDLAQAAEREGAALCHTGGSSADGIGWLSRAGTPAWWPRAAGPTTAVAGGDPPRQGGCAASHAGPAGPP